MARKLGGWAALSILAAFVGLAGCGGEEMTTTGSGGSGGATTTGGSAGTGGDDECAAPDEPAPASQSWCDRVVGGPKGAKSVAVNWSAAHATVRFFGVLDKYSSADQALSGALVSEDAFAGKDLSAYAKALPGVTCARAVSDAALGAASVT